MQKLVVLLMILLFPLCSFSADSSKFKIKPYQIQLQYAGNLGLFSVGAGKSFFNDKLNTFLIYGYLPKSIHGVTVHTIALKSSLRYANTELSPVFDLDFYTGALVLYGITNNTYLVYPDYFPDGYYITNAIHASIHIGARLNKIVPYENLQKISFYTELGTIDYQICNAITNNTIKIFDIWNLCFGVVFSLK